MPKGHVLVTGGAGFIGSHLVDTLLQRGFDVTVLDCLLSQVHGDADMDAEGWPIYLNPKARRIKGNILDDGVFERQLAGITHLAHMAASVGVGQSMANIVDYTRNNTLAAAVMLEVLSKGGHTVERMAVASSMSIYGEGEYDCVKCGRIAPQLRTTEQLASRKWEVSCPKCDGELEPAPTTETKPLFPTSIYAISKQDQEQLCLVMGRAYGVPTVALRYFNVYGTRQALSNPYTGICAIFSSRLLNGKPPLIFEDGEQSRDLVHVSDIVHANLLAMETDNADFQALNIGSGTSLTVNQIATLLAAELGSEVKAEIEGQYREGDIRHCFANIKKARTLLGYEPKVQLQDGVKELMAWVRQQTAADRVEECKMELAARSLMR